jgi:hypothetical protein
MGEKRELKKQEISYEGLFKGDEIYHNIKEWADEKGYDVDQEKHTETVTETGKEIKLPFELSKDASDYVKFVIKVAVELTNVEDVLVKKGENKQKLNKGDVSIKLKAIIETDYDNKWSKKPFWIFLRGLHDKFLRKSEVGEFESELKKDIADLFEELSAHLNLYRYKA